MAMPTTVVARRCLIALAVVAVAAATAVVGGCGGTSSAADRVRSENEAADQAAETLSLNGVTVTVPSGWDSESFINASGMSVFRVGSFAFPPRPDDDVGQVARESMAPGDVLINVVDFTATDPAGETNSHYEELTSPLTIEAADATGQEGYSVPAVIRSVRLDDHNFYVSVSFGRAPPSAAQVTAANAVCARSTPPNRAAVPDLRRSGCRGRCRSAPHGPPSPRSASPLGQPAPLPSLFVEDNVHPHARGRIRTLDDDDVPLPGALRLQSREGQ
jgi:hypothetical protein